MSLFLANLMSQSCISYFTQLYMNIKCSMSRGWHTHLTVYFISYASTQTNGSSDGEYVIQTGVSDSQNFGRIVTWEGGSSLDWWHAPVNTTPPANDKYCNMINGTDGSVFPPFLDEDSQIRIFVTDICRSIYFVHKGEEDHLGVKGLKFGFPDAFYDDPHDNGDNYCFCTQPEGDIEGLCTKGLIRIFPCKNGIYIVHTQQHEVLRCI